MARWRRSRVETTEVRVGPGEVREQLGELDLQAGVKLDGPGVEVPASIGSHREWQAEKDAVPPVRHRQDQMSILERRLVFATDRGRDALRFIGPEVDGKEASRRQATSTGRDEAGFGHDSGGAPPDRGGPPGSDRTRGQNPGAGRPRRRSRGCGVEASGPRGNSHGPLEPTLARLSTT